MKCVLVVDDSVTNLKFLESILKEYYKVILVKSGEQALKYLSRNPVDLVLLDIMMPEMDGFELFERIKALDNNGNVPVVFLTADVDVEKEIKGLEMGAVDFIRKPFIPKVMLNRINHIVQLEELKQNLEMKVREKTTQVEQLSFEIISTIASMIEAKDSYTKGHSVRVAEYSALVAQMLGWETKDIRNLKYIALLHDIGKVGIPDNVLNKPGRLTDNEFNIIKSHTTIGGDILKDIETIRDVDAGARYHHERFDGKGYPSGLAGEDIPMVARIICVADAYDAMNSKRIYRENLPTDVIRKELVDGRGTQFDAKIVDIFLNLLDAGKLDIDFEAPEREKTISGEGSVLINQIMKSIEEEAKRAEALDCLTGLLGRKEGEKKIVKAMAEYPGCLAFIDLDNLKRTNDTMGHLAGDFALKTVGEVLAEHGHRAAVSRLGGDEFLYFMIDVDKERAIRKVEEILSTFEKRKADNVYLSASSLSVGLCTTKPSDDFSAVLKKADKALYHVKQSGKCGYYFYNQEDGEKKSQSSVDLERLVRNLKKNGSQSGTLSVEYREFEKIYDFVRHLGERYDYDIQLLMITVDTVNGEGLYIDEREKVMNSMEKTIQFSLRSVDVCTRFSSEQFVVILMKAQKEDIANVTKRIAENFYKMYDRNHIRVTFDVAELGISEE